MKTLPFEQGVPLDIVEDPALAAGFSWGRDGALADELISRIGQCQFAALVEAGHGLDQNSAK